MDAGKTARSVLSLVLALCLAAPAAYASEPSGGGSPQGSEAQASPDSAAWLISELDDGGTFTACELAPYSAEMDAASVSAERFAFECGTDPGGCTLVPPDFESVSGGLIDDNVPQTLKNSAGTVHAFAYAHVGNVRVHYIGVLTIYDSNVTHEYVYYTTDDDIGDKTVYAVLKEGERISLRYDPGDIHRIEYSVMNAGGEVPADEKDLLTEDAVFGADRPEIIRVADSGMVGVSAAIPRGYTAEVTAKNANGEVLESVKLGEMPAWVWGGTDRNEAGEPDPHPNQIPPAPDSPTSLVLSCALSIKGIASDVKVELAYRRVDEVFFDASTWWRTANARELKPGVSKNPNDFKNPIIFNKPENYFYRIYVGDASSSAVPSDDNTRVFATGDGLVWNFLGRTEKSGNINYTWELDRLEINGTAVAVPVVALDSTQPASRSTELPTGTIITVTVKSLGGTNGQDGRRAYTIEAKNCRENLYITGANMVSDSHKEFILANAAGAEDVQAVSRTKNNGTLVFSWRDMAKGGLVAKTVAKSAQDPIRFKLMRGYKNPSVAFVRKNGDVLQTGAGPGFDSNTYIEYLMRSGVSDPATVPTENDLKVVPFNEWGPSEDGYYYFRGTQALEDEIRKGPFNVLQFGIGADPVKYGIDYQDGAGRADAPAHDNVEGLPAFQNGGEAGYNIAGNPRALVSNSTPRDISGTYAFDHWEILLVGTDEAGNQMLSNQAFSDKNGKSYKVSPGDDIHVEEHVIGALDGCVLHDTKRGREVLTLRAVWRKVAPDDPVTYRVSYILGEKRPNGTFTDSETIAERSHTVNSGATLVTDLYKGNGKTLSDSIMHVLSGANATGTDYTKGGRVHWAVCEEYTTKRIDGVKPEDNHALIRLYVASEDPPPLTGVWHTAAGAALLALSCAAALALAAIAVRRRRKQGRP